MGTDRETPNIVFLLADDQSYWSTGFNGHPAAKTPNLDRLAAEGFTFDRHYDTSPICMASRASIATGLYEYRTGCNFEHGRMPPGCFERSFYVRLREAGYFTGYAGKFGFGVAGDSSCRPPHDYAAQGMLPGSDFDWWKGQPGQASYTTAENDGLAHLSEEYPHLTLALGKASEEFFDRAADSGKPFCLAVGFKAPHNPPTPDPRFDAVYEDTAFPLPGNHGRQGAEHLAKQVTCGRQWTLYDRWNRENFDKAYRRYFQLIHGIDRAAGMIRDALEARELHGNTVIIFTSDNGYFCGSHRLGGKVLLYEEASRVPLVIYDPRHPSTGQGIRSGMLTANVDIAATMLDLAGVAAAENMDGRSLLPLLDNPKQVIHPSVNLVNFWNMPPTQGLAVTDGKFKYMYYWYKGERMVPTEELFDISEDPLEMENLARQPGRKGDLERMRECYDQSVEKIKEQTIEYNNYEHYGILLDRTMPWKEKQAVYQDFFSRWIRCLPSYRGGRWFEDLDLPDFPEEVGFCYGKPPRERR